MQGSFLKIYSFLTNNMFVNAVLISLKLDHKLQLAAGQWKAFQYNSKKSVQENAGFSHKPEVQQAIDKLKVDFTFFVQDKIALNSAILDFGCGPGIYLKLIENNYKISGIDVSHEMIEKAKNDLPNGIFYCGNFMGQNFDKKFSLIYSISVLEYVPVSQIGAFFEKCYSLLEDNGYIFIQYPHALSYKDTCYPDRNYISYSPLLIESSIENYFTIVSHKQFFDDRIIGKYDPKPYPTSSKDFRNGYLLIAQKRK